MPAKIYDEMLYSMEEKGEDKMKLKGKITFLSTDSYSSSSCSGRYMFTLDEDSDTEDPDLEDLELSVDIKEKPKWKGVIK